MKFVKGKMMDDGEAWEVNHQVSSTGRADPSRNNGASCPLKMRGRDPSQGAGAHYTKGGNSPFPVFGGADSPFHLRVTLPDRSKGTTPLAFVGAIALTFLGGGPLFFTQGGHRPLGPRRESFGYLWTSRRRSIDA